MRALVRMPGEPVLEAESVYQQPHGSCALSGASKRVHAALGLERLRGVRIAAHAAPVFEGEDPLSGGEFVYGSGVSEAILIGSRTPPGEIYTTKAFAPIAVLAAPGEFESQYVGNVPTPAGARPLYSLRERLGS